jgi:hypothetical protein
MKSKRVFHLAGVLGCIVFIQTLAYADVFSEVEACGSALWGCIPGCDSNPSNPNPCSACVNTYGDCMIDTENRYHNAQIDVCGTASACANGLQCVL